MEPGIKKSLIYSEIGISNHPADQFVLKPINLPYLLSIFPKNPEEKLKFIEELHQLIQKYPDNGPLILNSNGCFFPLNNTIDPLCQLIDITFQLAYQTKLLKKIPGLLKALLKRWVPKRHHYEKVCQYMSAFGFSERENINFQGIAIGLILFRILSKDSTEEREIPSYFYFLPPQAFIRISSYAERKWNLKEGFTFLIWIKPVYYEGESIKFPTLFRFSSGKKSTIDCIIKGQKLEYRLDKDTIMGASTIEYDVWNCIGIIHGSDQKIYIVINGRIEEFKAELRDINYEHLIICENFVCQMTATVLYLAALAPSKIVEIGKNLQHGICNYSHLEQIQHIQDEKCVFLLSSIRTSKNTVYSLIQNDKDYIWGNLLGNTGCARLPTQTMNIRYLFPVDNVLSILKFCYFANEKDEKKLLFSAIKTLLHFAQNLHKYCGNSKRANREYKKIGNILCYHLNLYRPSIMCIQTMSIIEKIILLDEILGKQIVIMLFETKKFWISTELECQKQYWKIMFNNYPLLPMDSERIITETISLMNQMYDPKFGSCCTSPQSLNNRFAPILSFLNGIMIKLSSKAEQIAILEIINFLKTHRCKISHCLLKTLIILLSGTNDINLDIKNAYSFLIEVCSEYPIDIGLACLEMLKVKVIPKCDKSVMKIIWKKAIKMFDYLFPEDNRKEEIKLIAHKEKKIKYKEPKEEDIEETKEDINSSDIDMEGCNAIEDDDNELELAEHCAIAMNRATSNIPFKSKTPTKRNDHQLISNSSQQIKQIYSFIMHSLTGEINEANYKDSLIINSNAISLCGIFIKKQSNSNILPEIISVFINICERKKENCTFLLKDNVFMSSLLKTGASFVHVEDETYSSKFEQIVQLCSILIIHAFYDGKLMKKIIKYFLFPKFKANTNIFLKTLWKRTLLKIKGDLILRQRNEKINYPIIGALYLARSTFQILLLSNKIDEKNSLKLSVSQQCTDIEILSMQFEILDLVIWEQILSNYESLLQIYIEDTKEFGSLNSITVMLVIMLGKVVTKVETKEWLKRAKAFINHLFFLLDKTEQNVEVIEKCVEITMGTLIKKCKETELKEDCHNLFMEQFSEILLNFNIFLNSYKNIESNKFFASVNNRNIIIGGESDLFEFVSTFECNGIDYTYVNHLKDQLLLNQKKEIESKRTLKNLIITQMQVDTENSESVMESTINITQKCEINSLLKTILREEKWRKMQAQLKRWQGAWRSTEQFNGMQKVPIKLSGHHFANGLRCVMKLRSQSHEYPFENYPHEIMPEEAFTMLNSVTLQDIQKYKQEPQEDLILLMYNAMNPKFKTKIMEPVNVEIIKELSATKGKLIIYRKTRKKILLVFGNSKVTEKEDFRFMFNCKVSQRKFIHKWSLGDIKRLYKKQIVEKNSGLEISFSTGGSILFCFETEDIRDLFCSKLVRLREKYCTSLEYFGTLDPIKSFKMCKITQRWQSWKISTLDYLLALNLHSSRSFHNLSQYPIFPWVLIEDKKLRDLSKNIGMLGDPDRAEEYKRRYFQEDLSGHGHFHFGSHYSNPGIVLQYTMRVYPFFEGYLKIFSGLDDPNRMFHSITDSFTNVTKDLSDVRELIPEFYSLPELYLNTENIFFGPKEQVGNETKEIVDKVVLPEWAEDNPYEYIIKLREALESNEVNVGSKSITRWIDLIFGYQQRGEEAEKAYNVFTQISYDIQSILAGIKNDTKLCDAYKIQAFHLGQIPIQLFKQKHRNRSAKHLLTLFDEFSFFEWVEYEGECDPNSRILKDSQNKLRFFTIGFDGYCKEWHVDISNPASPKLINDLVVPFENNYLNKGIVRVDYEFKDQLPYIMLQRKIPQCIVQGGYWDGSIQFTPISATAYSSTPLQKYSTTVTCIEIDKEEKLIFVGTQDGEVNIYTNGMEAQWELKGQLFDHGDVVSSIYISDDMQLFIAASLDGTANMYNLSTKPKLIRTFWHPKKNSINNVFLSQNPLPCAVLFSKESTSLLTFSINGELLQEIKEETQRLISPKIARDSFFNEYLVYLREKGDELVVRKLPYLKMKIIPMKYTLKSFEIFEDSHYAIEITNKGKILIQYIPLS